MRSCSQERGDTPSCGSNKTPPQTSWRLKRGGRVECRRGQEWRKRGRSETTTWTYQSGRVSRPTYSKCSRQNFGPSNPFEPLSKITPQEKCLLTGNGKRWSRVGSHMHFSENPTFNHRNLILSTTLLSSNFVTHPPPITPTRFQLISISPPTNVDLFSGIHTPTFTHVHTL